MEEASTKGQETKAAAAPRPPALPWTVRLHIFGLVAATDIAQRADGTVNRFVFSASCPRTSPYTPRAACGQYAGVLGKKGKVVQLVEFDEAIHGFFWFPELPETGKLTAKTKAFMESSA